MDVEVINQILNITESYQAPQRMLELVLDDSKRTKLFEEFLKHESDLSYEWFQSYFEDEHSDRKEKKQDFTPNSISVLMARLIGPSDRYFEAAAGTGGILIKYWHENKRNGNQIYQVEELSDRAIPFLLFNMAIRGIEGLVFHGDSLTRYYKEVYELRRNHGSNYSDVFLKES